MTPRDTLALSFASVASTRTRSLLIVLAMAMGVAAVVVLTALGDGARRYVVGQFSALGTNLVIVLPGRAETSGGVLGAALGQTPRDLTLADARAVGQLPGVRRYAPLNVGTAEVAAGGRLREVTVLGSNAELLPIRHMALAQGRFSGDPGQIVLGRVIARELFADGPALGQRVRLGDRRFRVTGVLAAQGESMGFNTDETVIVPVDDAQALFNTETLFRILVEADSRAAIEPVQQATRRLLQERHDGEEDVTVITQDAVLATFDRILTALTLAVGGIAAISLGVAGVLIMNVMLVAVSQRTTEIGLLKAVGASGSQILRLFLTEAAMLSLLGAALGIVLAYIGIGILGQMFPNFPLSPPNWALGAAVGISLVTGLVFGVMPARRAARLDPVQALARR